jgi:hypothetical protein
MFNRLQGAIAMTDGEIGTGIEVVIVEGHVHQAIEAPDLLVVTAKLIPIQPAETTESANVRTDILAEIAVAEARGNGTEIEAPRDVTPDETTTKGHQEETGTYLRTVGVVVHEEVTVAIETPSVLDLAGIERRAPLHHLKRRNLHRI